MSPFFILGAAAVTACASAGAGTTVDANSPNIITGEQVAASAQTNAYDLVIRLRPNS